MRISGVAGENHRRMRDAVLARQDMDFGERDALAE
jgi:hypothetical protein